MNNMNNHLLIDERPISEEETEWAVKSQEMLSKQAHYVALSARLKELDDLIEKTDLIKKTDLIDELKLSVYEIGFWSGQFFEKQRIQAMIDKAEREPLQ